MEEEEEELLHLPVHRHPLTPWDMSGSRCSMCFRTEDSSSIIEGYLCRTCFPGFHKDCAESPLKLPHPPHPPHSLSLRPPADTEASSETCSCCGERLGGGWVYHCPICRFIIHLRCAKKPPVLEVDHPKSHDHKLILLPKPRPFTCDACGLQLDGPSLPWGCHQCGAMLHRECMDLPRVIRISRHPQHRLCYVSSPTPPLTHESSWSCRVFPKVGHNQYGAYFCIKDECRYYIVHSKCATREDVWDGRDFEGELEEPEDIEPPFEVINDKVIRHFSHEHLKLLNKDDDDGGVSVSFDGSEHCGICALPIHINIGNIYICMQCDCDFILHEKCVNLPRKTWYMLHPHRLKLQARGKELKMCDVCARDYYGFTYRCCNEDCPFKVDVNSASVYEPFIHITHPHPLFPTSNLIDSHTCSGCKERESYNRKTMQCIECDFNLRFECITLPSKVSYKQDRHPLVLGGGGGEEEAATGGGSWWCEISELKMEPDKEMYYTSDSCCVTVHVHCVLGRDPLMKPGRYADPWEQAFEVTTNNSCCRPICQICRRRCPFPIVFKQNDLLFCTLNCLCIS
ncbi:PREDICTED: uncharacterized protein LOC104802891 [Tarenaya hassleriana]|uniref:uncharacterized protein LOC104802891 n=1 Tax=Tarenaya hassleriana TaxID=28532 RepID=UPI00053C1F82|nr:PREDICTED: uncharacterized protein LOC104802891 [Tarenaya hassleriana]